MANDNKDQALLDIFIEEATDLVAALSHTVRQWESNLQDLSKIADLKRDLHTLKGSARMVGQMNVGALAHTMETLVEALEKGALTIDRKVFDLVHQGEDRLELMVEMLKNKETPPAPDDLYQKFNQVIPSQARAAATAKPAAEEAAPVLSEAERKDVASQVASQTEMVRIRLGLLEKLNSLSTENSMIRVGLEQHIVNLGSYISEIKQEARRLEGQLGNLSSEIQNYVSNGEFFYPKMSSQRTVEEHEKEQERYVTLDQMGNVIKETTFDLVNILKNISDTQAMMESLVLNQARVSTELQHRLSDTRLTPFESIVPRLGRIARQVSTELNKEVDFKVIKSEGEMDRTVLERLIPSLEHILRNAIDHGIESPAERRKLGKPEVGKVEVKFSRTSSLASIEVTDDGAGINPDNIRKKAIQLKLLPKNAAISNEEVLKYILEPGFSTRESVTEISGRGVGMDVVNTAVKELGGNLSIVSEPGKGTTITVRFPFTASLNRILMFNLQDQIFGLLLTHIETVISIGFEDLQAALNQKKPMVQHGGKAYYLFYLGELMGAENKSVKISKKKSFSLVLISTTQIPMAILIDNLLYSRELIVQSLGAQFKLTNECSGATLLGDGRVVLILDPFTLALKAKTLMEHGKVNLQIVSEKAPAVSGKAWVMVVDDSMSVRAVTKRMLESHNYRVILAKDGVDAIHHLEGQIPDVILLDLDMPRMDGFEFASTIRADARYQSIPIIVVSSRASKIQQVRAEELKLNGFIKKPYPESELLAILDAQLGNTA